MTLVAALYIGLQVVAQGVLGAELPNAAAPLLATATAIFGPWGTRLLLATTVLSVSGYLSADMLCSPRNLHTLGERRQLPRVLASVHPRFKTPAVAVRAYAVMCAFVAWSGSFRQLIIVATSGTLVLYLICCLGLFRLRAGMSPRACLALGTRVSRSRLLTSSRVARKPGPHPDADPRPGGCGRYGLIGTALATAHMNAISSRAIAVTATFGCFPRATSRRKRLHSRTCAFHPMS